MATIRMSFPVSASFLLIHIFRLMEFRSLSRSPVRLFQWCEDPHCGLTNGLEPFKKIQRLIFLLCLLGLFNLSAKKVRAARPEPAKMFQQLDADSNQELSQAEFLAGKFSQPDEMELSADQLEQRFLVFDRDQSRSLSLEEFLTIPGVVENADRGDVADPFVETVQNEIKRLIAKLSLPVSAQDLPAKWRGITPDSIPLNPEDWDLNQDRHIDQDEAQRGLEIAFGLRRPDGEWARSSQGFVFNGSYFNHLDHNQDRKLSKRELVARYHLGPELAITFLQTADQNQDDQLDLQEIDAAGLFQTDVANEFLKWDRNFDGQISAAELQQGGTWQRNLAVHMLPVFDENRDQQLSLQEYWKSPLGNPLENWTSLRIDKNGDGHLGLQEFFLSRTLCCSGLAAFYFHQLDQNQDGRLTLGEFSFHVDPSKLSADQLLAIHDRNDDGMVSLLELCSLPGRPEWKSTSDILIPGHIEQFHEADENQDGLLSQQEFFNAPELHLIAQTEARLRQELWPRFSALDLDHDGELDAKEWSHFTASPEQNTLQQDFQIADADESDTLNFVEFTSIPAVNSVHLRPSVNDPVVENCTRLLHRLRPHWMKTDSRLAADDVARFIQSELPFFSLVDLVGWDMNSDGAYQFSEVRFGLQKLFAIKAPTGQWLRRRNGQVFNWRTVKDADRDNNQKLSRDEFIAVDWKQDGAAQTRFQQADFNQDQQLSLSELLHSDLFWVDTQMEFRRYDTDQDGLISPAELKRQARSYERRMAAFMFPAFDANKDQQLSFHEFRNSPLANPVHDYDSRRWDQNYDGKLSLMEFHRSPTENRIGLGLSSQFFRLLDVNRDQFLSFAEMTFSADLKKLPSASVFEMLDTNGDGALELSELLKREQPRDQSAWAKRNSQQRSMEVEDAFLIADTDRSRSLSLVEFQAETSNIRDVVLGMTLHRRPVKATVDVTSRMSGRFWLISAVIGANLLLFLGVALWRWKRLQ